MTMISSFQWPPFYGTLQMPREGLVIRQYVWRVVKVTTACTVTMMYTVCMDGVKQHPH